MSDLITSLKALGTDVTPWDAIAPEQQTPIQAALGSQAPPQALVCPTTQAQLADVMACAYQNRWRVLPCGSGSKLGWGGLAEGIDLVVSTRCLNRIIDHAVGDLTVTAEAGLTLAELQQTLAAANQMLPLDPAYPQQATLAGLIATGDAGSLRQRYGGIRDLLIGLSWVRHDGQIAKAGGRVVKNVAGYDLMKLMTGSYGTLGILSQVTFRTYPVQEASQTVVFSGSATAINQLSQTLRLSALTPVALDVLSPALMAALGQQDFGLAARFQSITAGVEEQVQRLLALGQAQNLVGQVLTGEADARFWQQSGAQVFAEQTENPVVIVKVGVLPEAAVSLLEQLQGEAGSLGRIHASSGVGQIRLEGEAAVPERVLKLRSHCEAAAGYLTVLTAPMALKQAVDVWGYPGNALD
ncbi:MAG: FAD-binding oxidoreductase, partial [Cyanobacteria bacterium Co-bin8]|nr:FAD-binding oxidoreductase [Cyanobacteria bacterium Co-bin8]